MASNDRTVALVGGAGYIGGTTARALLAAGYRVRILDRCFFGTESLDELASSDRFELVRVDTRDLEAAHFDGAGLAIDLAGLSNDPSCELDDTLTQTINIDGGVRALDAARAAGVRRYLYQSSCSVYGSSRGTMATEVSPVAPVSAYARSKVALEEAALERHAPDFEVVVSRLATVFGLAARMRFDLIINIMTLKADHDGRVFVLGGGNQWRPLIHVRDVARSHQLLLEAPADTVAGEIFNVGDTAHNYRVSRVARLVARTVGDTEVVAVPDDPDRRSYRVDFGKFQRAFDFSASLTPEDGVREILLALHEDSVDTGPRTRTVAYYRYLLDARRVLDDLILDGRLL